MNKIKIAAGGIISLAILSTYVALAAQLFIMNNLNLIKKSVFFVDNLFLKFFVFSSIMMAIVLLNNILISIKNNVLFKKDKDKKNDLSLWKIIKSPFVLIGRIILLSIISSAIAGVLYFFDQMLNEGLFNLTEKTIQIMNSCLFGFSIVTCVIMSLIVLLDLIFFIGNITKCMNSEKDEALSNPGGNFFVLNSLVCDIYEEKIKEKENDKVSHNF